MAPRTGPAPHKRTAELCLPGGDTGRRRLSLYLHLRLPASGTVRDECVLVTPSLVFLLRRPGLDEAQAGSLPELPRAALGPASSVTHPRWTSAPGACLPSGPPIPKQTSHWEVPRDLPRGAFGAELLTPRTRQLPSKPPTAQQTRKERDPGA